MDHFDEQFAGLDPFDDYFPDAASPSGGGAEDNTAANPSGEPAEGSDDAASLEFGRNLSTLREARGLSHNKLAALADIAAASIRGYELGKYRPLQPKLWGLARVLDVMPIQIGPGSTRGGDPPVALELLLLKKGGRAVRLQRLVELLSESATVSDFAALAGMEPEEVYAVASSDGQLSEAQLEPFLTAFPQVRRSWLMGGEGDALQPVTVRVPAVETAPLAEVAATGSRSSVPRPFSAEPALGMMPVVQALTIPAELRAGAPIYVPLGAGLVAEVDAVLVAGAGAVSGFRLLAGAGSLPALTNSDQLERLFNALSGVLDQRGAE